jgi:hypothetical protein
MWRSLTTDSIRWFKCIPNNLTSHFRSYSIGHAATDTIYALSSGASKAGVAVIRVSGPNASHVSNQHK